MQEANNRLKDSAGSRFWLLMIIYAALAMMLFFTWAVPRQKRLAVRIADLQAREKEAAQSKWPQDAALLTERLKYAEEFLSGSDAFGNGVEDATKSNIDAATLYFRKRIEEKFTSVQDFMLNASHLDYKDLFDRVSHECQSAQINMTQDCLMRANSKELPVYQMLAKLWSIQRVIQLVIECKMTVLHNDKGYARLYAFRPRGYVLTDDPEERPFLMEVPVMVVARGTNEQFLRLAALFQNGENMLPMRHLAIQSEPPDDGKTSVNEQIYTIWCTAFFPME